MPNRISAGAGAAVPCQRIALLATLAGMGLALRCHWIASGALPAPSRNFSRSFPAEPLRRVANPTNDPSTPLPHSLPQK